MKTIRYRIHAIVFIVIIQICLASNALSQVSLSNAGKKFLLTFPANAKDVQYLNIYLTGKKQTQCKVAIPGLGFTKVLTIIPNTISTVFIPFTPPFSAEIRESEKIISGKAIQIDADSEIVVYGLSHSNGSTDAFLGLPIHSLSNEYYALCYQTEITSYVFGTFHKPGEIIIIAIQDSSLISIAPSCNTLLGKNKGLPFTILMNTGDIYLLQSDTLNALSDLTGTHLISNKPIAVLSGHNEAIIPDTSLTIKSEHATSDFLLEMLPPISSWGNSAVVIPFATTQAPDLIRVLSSEDGNTININGTDVATLNAGQFYEMQGVSQPLVIRSTNPMLVGQYMHSTVDSIPYGDPALTLVFPVEQYDTAYTIMSIQDPAYVTNFINITTPTSNIGTVELDGVLIPAASFKVIAGSNYSFAQLKVSQGVHNMRALKGFGVTVYALGAYDSYAYPGGTLLKPLVPAEVQLNTFDTILNCQSEDRFITIYNPNSVEARVSSISVTESVPSSFVVNASIPLIIPAGDTARIPVKFTPQDTGLVTGKITVEFNSPRHQKVDITISAYARKLPMEFKVPSETHLLGGEEMLVPFYAKSNLAQLNSSGYNLTVRYDPTYIQDIDYVQDGTLSLNGYINVQGIPGNDVYTYTGSIPITGGGVSEKLPLLYIKFKSIYNSASENTVNKYFPIDYDVAFLNTAIGDGCLLKKYDAGMIVLDSSCANPHIVWDTAAPMLSSIDPGSPNPFSGKTILGYTIGTMSAGEGEIPVRIEMRNELGMKVKTIVDEPKRAGFYNAAIDGSNLSPGIYFIVLDAGGIRKYSKVMLMR